MHGKLLRKLKTATDGSRFQLSSCNFKVQFFVQFFYQRILLYKNRELLALVACVPFYNHFVDYYSHPHLCAAKELAHALADAVLLPAE